MSFSFERRANFRYETSETRKIEYALSIFDIDTFEGLIVNMSDTGLCILISNPLSVKQEILVKDDPYGSFNIVTVQWIEKVDEEYYKVGLKY